MVTVKKSGRVFVDALKMAQQDALEIVVDQTQRLATVYEGGEATGADWDLVEYQHRHNLVHTHVPLTDDGDSRTLAVGSWGGRCLSMAPYVMVMGATDGAAAAGGG